MFLGENIIETSNCHFKAKYIRRNGRTIDEDILETEGTCTVIVATAVTI